MGSQGAVVSSTYSPDFVASAFVERYYNILYTSPQHSHHFYQDISSLSRPGNDGKMTTVTTMNGISEKLMSLDYKDSLVTIEAVSAQGSASDGVLIGVTGFLTGKDNLKKDFSQVFFLAKQENGFFVLNDILHFIKSTTLPAPLAPLNVEEKTTSPVPPTPESEADNVIVDLPNGKVSSELETKSSSAELMNVRKQSEIANSSPPEKVDLPKDSVEKVAVPEPPSNKNQKTKDLSREAAKKKSYASILGKEKIVTSVANSDEDKAAASVPSKQPKKEIVSPVVHSQGESSVPVLSNHHQDANNQKQGESIPLAQKPHYNNNRRSAATSIYVGGLPRGIDVATLKAAAEEYGDVKENGIQIVTYQDGFTFGFVEFESPESAQNAIEAHKLTFGEKEAYIVYKRSNMQGGVSRGMPNNMNRRGDSYGNRNYNNNNYNYYNNRG